MDSLHTTLQELLSSVTAYRIAVVCNFSQPTAWRFKKGVTMHPETLKHIEDCYCNGLFDTHIKINKYKFSNQGGSCEKV